MPVWRQRRMRTQWGNCSPRGEITLNTNLVKASTHLIDYVIQHEVCHLRHYDHGKHFRRLMDEHMPDWRARRRELNADSGLLAD
jgi:predicted metal-dependent hydrolase